MHYDCFSSIFTIVVNNFVLLSILHMLLLISIAIRCLVSVVFCEYARKSFICLAVILLFLTFSYPVTKITAADNKTIRL